MQLGVLPEFHQHWLDHFLAQGVPRDGIEIVEPAADHPLAAIARQANGVPTAEVVLLADRLTSRRMRRLLDRSQSGPTPSVRVFPMPLTGITEANGWYKPGGIPLVLKEALRLFPEPSPDLP
jgi:hypothetical protein